MVSRAIKQHDRDAAKFQLPDSFVDAPDRRKQHTANPLLHKNEQLGTFSICFLRTIANLHRVTAFVYAVLSPDYQIGVKRVGNVHNNHANGATPTGPKLARRFVGDPAEFCDGKLHSASRRLSNNIRRIQNIRDGAQ